MQTILFDSADLPGDARMRRERWVDSLSSGYVRLRADAMLNTEFNGRLNIMLVGPVAVGRISGTVQSIARTTTEIAAQNTDNAVLLLNKGQGRILVEQKGKRVDCGEGAAVLIEQCEPSTIKASPQHLCDFVAVQLPRQQLRRYACGFEDRFMMHVSASTSALTLLRAYVRALLGRPDAERTDIPSFVADHVADLVAAVTNPGKVCHETQAPNLRAARFKDILSDLDRNFMMPGISLTTLARRLAISPRYVQALFSEAATSFTDEVIKRRLARAHDMLTSPRHAHMNVMEVAYECGFSTTSHFHRIFRRHFDTTPRKLREAARRKKNV